MHYFSFNIGDYASHTRHLSMLEDLAYRRLLDAYYLAEEPLNGTPTDVAREIGMAGEVLSVAFVLDRYFTNENGFWVNSRVSREIAAFRLKIEQASRAGKASAEHRSNSRSTPVQPTTNHKPITTNHKPVERSPNGSRLPKDWELPEDYKTFCQQERPDLDPQDVANRFRDYWVGVAGAKGRKADWLATWRNWVRGDKRNGSSQIQLTVPSQQGVDPALAKIIADDMLATQPSKEIREKLKQLGNKH